MRLGNKLKAAVPPMDAGSYIGICIGVVGLGEQESTYQNKTRYVEKIRFIFEVPGETIEVDGEEKPRQLSVDFSAARKPTSRIRQFINTWLAKTLTDTEYEDLDLFSLVRRNALLTVVHSEDGQYANIASAAPLPKGFPAREPVSELIMFDADEWDDAAFEKLPEYLQDRLKKSTQYRNKHLPEEEVSVETAAAQTAADAEEEAPF